VSTRTTSKRRLTHEVDSALPARQQRSQMTTERLLEAAESLLRESGADAATLRAIADRAGVSVGIVYRRFRDKDTVLRAVYTRFFAGIDATNRRALDSDRLRDATTPQILSAVVTGIGDGYRRHRTLVRALVLYARSHPDPVFRRRAMALNAAAFGRVRRLLLRRQREIRHPKPAAAVAFGLSAIAALLQERIVFGDVTALPVVSDGELIAEATRMLQSYLRVQETD
jgi:AcrR family transcriptional regulator